MDTIVKTRQGAIEGLKSADGESVIFRGVPYAKPPVGGLRFRRPEPREPWEGVLPCREFAPKCPQADLRGMELYGREFYDGDETPMDEDCLYLNLWTPADAEPGQGLPVLFWIHGGAFLHGCGSEKEFDGEGFAKKGVVLVTINYRVNVFGFFSHPDLERENGERVSGNYGLLDQLAALRWVRDNIAAFGGDPERVTLAGQSAGCMSVQCLISSPLTQGLVTGAILQSGGGLGALHGTPGREPLWEVSRKLMEHLNVSSIDELREIPAERLRDAAYAVNGEGLSWRPHQDNWLLPGTVDELARSGSILDIPYLIGSTEDDIGGSDRLQKSGERWCENQLRLGCTPARLYFFNRKLPGDQSGAFHSSELWYEFETLPRCWRPWEACDWELARAVSGYWANFAKCGDPNGDGLPRWEPYTDSNWEPIRLGAVIQSNGNV